MARRKSSSDTDEGSRQAAWPAPWDNGLLVGHEAAEKAAIEAVESGRMAHAWLISGPRGIGKSTFAHRFARYLLAGEGGGGLFGAPSTLQVDMDLPAVRRMSSGAHPDFRRVERGIDDRGRRRSEIVVADVRGIGEFMHLTPAEGGWRIVIVDAADEMNRNAANAVLKLLEEPPRRALLLLVAHSPGRLLATVRSRCRRLPLHPLTQQQVDGLLTSYMPEVSAIQRRIAVAMSDGSIGQALALARADVGGLYDEIMALLASLPTLDIPRLHGFAERIGRRGEETDLQFDAAVFLLDWWLKRAIKAASTETPLAALVPGENEASQRLMAAASLDRWVDAWEKIGDLYARAEAVSLDRKQATLGAFFALQAAIAG